MGKRNVVINCVFVCILLCAGIISYRFLFADLPQGYYDEPCIIAMVTISDESFNSDTQEAQIFSGASSVHNDLYNIYKTDLNSASYDQFLEVDGIGPSLAQRIIDYREINGDFSSFDDILNVNGIGNAKYEELKKYFYVEGDINHTDESATTVPDDFCESNTEICVIEQNITSELSVEPDVDNILIDEWNDVSDNEQKSDSTTDTDTEITVVCFPIELNSATVEELVQINGIGEKTASRIVLYAESYGFYSIEDLLDVPGIGQATYEKIKEYVYVDATGLDPKETTTTASQTETTVTTEFVPELPIELNNATIEELMWIDGIGQTLAIRIIAYGQQVGYYSIDDLLNVNGIGQSKLELIRPYVCVDTSGLTSQTTTEGQSEKLDLMTCTKEELIEITGIEESMADEIIFARKYLDYSQIRCLWLINGMTDSIYNTIISHI